MPTPTIVLLFGAVIALAVFAAIWSAKVERQRVATLAEWGKRSGWRLELGTFSGPALSYPLFQIGHSRSMRDRAKKELEGAVPGLDPVSAVMFEYHYAVTTSNGKTTTTHHYHFVCAHVHPGLDLGSVLIRPESWGDKIAGAIGFDDIDFEDAQFSKRYYVSASDRRRAYDLIDGPMMRFLNSVSAPRIETNGRELLVHVPGKATAESYTSMAFFVSRFLAQIPRPLVNAERARSGLPAMLEAGNAAASSRKSLEDLESR
jgi:hypothetical protein